MYRDWLRTHPEDRDRCAELKREVALRGRSGARARPAPEATGVTGLS